MKNLTKGGKCLDVGGGSGYITACLSEALGAKGRVVAVDSNEEVLGFARRNICKNHSNLIENNRISFITADPRKIKLTEKFDVIHFGQAIFRNPA